MKWDKENKERLSRLLSDRLDSIRRENKHHTDFRRLSELLTERKEMPRVHHWSDSIEEEFDSSPIVREWRAFTSQYGIIEVARSRKDSPWRTGGWPKPIHTCPKATNPKRIIIEDPLDLMTGARFSISFGLSIPKDIAEKFLVLGIP